MSDRTLGGTSRVWQDLRNNGCHLPGLFGHHQQQQRRQMNERCEHQAARARVRSFASEPQRMPEEGCAEQQVTDGVDSRAAIEERARRRVGTFRAVLGQRPRREVSVPSSVRKACGSRSLLEAHFPAAFAEVLAGFAPIQTVDAAAMKRRMRSSCFLPSLASTPEWTSTPQGFTALIACATFSGVKPPARMTGTLEVDAIRAEMDQS